MNPICFICQEPASRVCQHAECQQPAFFCNTFCVDRQSEILHTHNNSQDIIPFKQYQRNVQDIRNTLDPEILHHEHKQKILKRALIIEEHVKYILREMIKKHERDLYELLKMNLLEETQKIMSKVNQDRDAKYLIGKQLNTLFKNKRIYVSQQQLFISQEQMKNNFFIQLDLLEKSIKGKYTSYEQRIDISQQIINIGQQLQSQRKWKQAREKYQKALQVNKFTSQIYFKIGVCLNMQDKLTEAKRNYEKSLSINPNNPKAFTNIAVIEQKKKQHLSALQYYNEAILYDSNNAIRYQNRGDCYLTLKRLEQAKLDYEKAILLKPSQKYSQKLEEIEKKIKQSQKV